jgi:hypothetical protein
MEKQNRTLLQTIAEIISGGPFFSKVVKKNLLFTLTLTFIGLAYIRNSHLAQQQAETARVIQLELKELKAEYLTVSAELSRLKRQSMVMKRVDSLGLKPLHEPPFELIID